MNLELNTRWMRRRHRTWRAAAFLFAVGLCNGCRSHGTAVAPSIQFTRVPQATLNDPDKLDIVQGRVIGARPGQQIVLYVKTGKWFIQPLPSEPFTTLSPDSTWINSAHLGSEYAALLVEPNYRPQATLESLPATGNGVAAVASSKDFPSATVISTTLKFSGYDWRIRNAPSSRGDRPNPYSTANAWTDEKGALHLRIAREADKWTCAEVTLTRSFGYGLYSVVVRDTSKLGAREAFAIFTYDYAGGDQNHREMGIEVLQRTTPESTNGQYVIQPFYVAANVNKFAAPAGLATYSFRWEPGKLTFRTVSGAATLSEHVFTSGVPSPGVETVRMALYIFGVTDNPEEKEAEVVIDKFEFVP